MQTTTHLRRRFSLALLSLFVLTGLMISGSLWFTQNPLRVQASTPSTQSSSTGTGTQSSTTTAVTSPANANYERGIIYPRWQPTAYGATDTAWQSGIKDAYSQTSARWLEMPILFSQDTSNSTQVKLSQSTPSVATFTTGIQTAHALGYKVFFVPLMSVKASGGWSGSINLPNATVQQKWFNSYWSTLKPYIEAAQNNGVEQMAIGTELQLIQTQVPASYWNDLIAQIRSVFKQNLTYDMNWYSLTQGTAIPSWFQNSDLAMIGVSSYIPLASSATPVPADQIATLWKQKVQSQLDALSIQVGKPVLISEIGYRDTSDALYQTWLASSSAPVDTTVQAEAFDATLSNAYSDPHIGGTFFWGWDDVNMFTIKNRPAAQILQKWYSLS